MIAGVFPKVEKENRILQLREELVQVQQQYVQEEVITRRLHEKLGELKNQREELQARIWRLCRESEEEEKTREQNVEKKYEEIFKRYIQSFR